MDHVFLVSQVSAVDDHTASCDGQGEEGLAHCPHPNHGIFQSFPARREHELIAFDSAGQHGNTDSQNNKDDEEQRHHDLVALLDAFCAQEQGQQSTHHHDDMEGDYGIVRGGERVKPTAGVYCHQLTGDGVEESLQHVGDNASVADGNAHGTSQGQPAQQTAGFAKPFAAGGPGVAVRT